MLEAKFYFRAAIAGSEETLVLGSLYSPADGGLHRHSHGALNVFEYCGEESLVVIRATDIRSVVTLTPFPERVQRPRPRFFLVEKFSLGVVDTGIILE
jgi:hypothetical protein